MGSVIGEVWRDNAKWGSEGSCWTVSSGGFARRRGEKGDSTYRGMWGQEKCGCVLGVWLALPIVTLQRKRSWRLRRKKKDNCGSENFEKWMDSTPKWNCVFIKTETLCPFWSVSNMEKEESMCIGVSQVMDLVVKRDNSPQIASVFSELGMREEERV